ncbi:MAG: IclR family transcriptional regulator [Microbacterium sp.]|uniref:IclR family transcriptional regulator n=1 Tax=Microbacterium sp. TaxID=51671 RepID=UPI0039E304D2
MEVSASSSPRRGGRPAVGEPLLDRAFRLISTFSEERPSMSLTQLSEASQIPLSTTLRLAQHLSRLGMLERDAEGKFRIGLRLFERATLAPRGHGIRATALAFMEDLHRATRQHVLLCVQDGDEAVLIERLSTPNAGKVDYRVGGRLPLHGTGVGLALLAHANPHFVDSYLAQPREFEGRPVDVGELRHRLRRIRDTGVARNARVTPEPAVSVASPLRQRGTVVAALSVVGADGSLDSISVEPAVVAIARAISRQLTSQPHT